MKIWHAQQQRIDGYLSFQPSQRRTNAKMYSLPERQMLVRLSSRIQRISILDIRNPTSANN
jgi:hypothetical protein